MLRIASSTLSPVVRTHLEEYASKIILQVATTPSMAAVIETLAQKAVRAARAARAARAQHRQKQHQQGFSCSRSRSVETKYFF